MMAEMRPGEAFGAGPCSRSVKDGHGWGQRDVAVEEVARREDVEDEAVHRQRGSGRGQGEAGIKFGCSNTEGIRGHCRSVEGELYSWTSVCVEVGGGRVEERD